LLVIDCDTQESIEFFAELANKINLSLDTLIVKTRRGAHYYYYCTFSEQLEKKQFVDQNRNIKIDLLAGNKCQSVAPFSMLKLDHEGNVLKKDAENFILFVYEPINVPESLPELTPDLYNSLIDNLEKSLQKTKEKPQTTATIITITNEEERKLTDEEIQKIIELVAEHFVEGQRQNLILYLSGYLRKELNVSIESIYKIYQYLEPVDDKDDIKKRYDAIERTFKKPTDDVSGYKGLASMLGEDKAKELCNKIKQILNIPLQKTKNKKEKTENKGNNEDFLDLLDIQNTPPEETENTEENTEKNKVIYVEISKKNRKYARCNFDKKIIEYGQFRKDERTEQYFFEVNYTVFDCVIDKIYAIENPLTQEKKYEIHFVSKNPEEAHTVLKGTLQEIWEEMKAKTSYVLNSSVALNVLTAVFSYYLKQNWYEKKKEELPMGFYYFNGQVIAQGFEEREYTKEDLQKAALFLNEYIYSHPNPRLIANVIRAGLLLPFSFAQKQMIQQGLLRKRMRYLFLTGETKTGKTTTAMLLCKIWGTENKISYASFCTEARAAKHLSNSTHILIIDEVSKDLETSVVKELLKYAQEDIMARIILNKSQKQIYYPALSGLIMTSNSHFPEDPALLERFHVFRFRKKDKISAIARARYEKEDFNKLYALGQFVWKYVKAHGLRDDYIDYATLILRKFYEEAEVYAQWLDWEFYDDTNETQEEQEYKKEMDFFTAVLRFFIQNKVDKETPLAQAIYKILMTRQFPRWVWADENYCVYITNDFLNELQKFYRCSIKNLEELKEITGWRKMYKRCLNTRIWVLQTTMMELFYRLNLVPDFLTTAEFHDWINNRLQIKFSEEFIPDDSDTSEIDNTLNKDLPF
jgi:hypothetical protein